MGESVEQFITSLYTLAENCDYGDLKDQMIRDRIVVGIRDQAQSERIQTDSYGFDLGEGKDPCTTTRGCPRTADPAQIRPEGRQVDRLPAAGRSVQR